MPDIAAPSPSPSAPPAPLVPSPREPVRPDDREVAVRERGQWAQIVRRFVRHRAAVVSLGVFICLVLLAFVGPMLWKYSFTDISSVGGSPPTLNNPFGTDNIGHDNFARVLRGMQQSLKVGFSVMILATGIGAPYGAISGLLGGRIDTIMMRVCDVLLVLPLLAIAAAIGSGAGGTIVVISLVLGLLGWAVMARIVRGVSLSLREQEFIEAARAMGAGTLWIVFRHVLPNVVGAIIVQATLDIAVAILVESALSFLGVGIQPPDTSLGALTNLARPSVDTQWWLFYAPGIMIILIALTINFIGDGLRDAFDPRQTRQRR
jgi:peptide/nickel transport system permease protein